MTSQKTDLERTESKTTPAVAERMRSRRVFLPKTDILETPDEILVFADMPGVDEKSVDVTLEKNTLTLHGRVDFEQPDNQNLAYWEFRVGDYERVFSLSEEVSRDGIEASVRNGVLRVRLSKAAPFQTKKITVRAE